MSYTTKRKILNSTVYIVLGLIITAVLCITVATFIGMKKEKPGIDIGPSKSPSSELSTQAPGNSKESVPPTTPAIADHSTPTPTEPSKEPSGNSGTSVIDPVKPVIYIPADGTLLKEYSMDIPVFSLTMNDYRVHTGIDISAPIGAAVVAVTDGTILDIYSDPMMGMTVAVDHGEGLISYYKNLSAIIPEGIAKGVTVKAGTIIGAVGDTSLVELADTEHLHFEMTKDGKHLDPAGYLDLTVLGKTDSGKE